MRQLIPIKGMLTFLVERHKALRDRLPDGCTGTQTAERTANWNHCAQMPKFIMSPFR